MYPAHYYGLYPAFPRDSSVFVAMSFDTRFTSRWTEVIKPAISSISKDGQRLTPIRVDAKVVGDSILTEILSGIGRAEVVFADITSIGFLEDKPVRSGNVMYEVGLAHAVRLPEEVLLFRSDNDPLPFDTVNVRVNSYSPDSHPDCAKTKVAESIQSALKEVNLRRNLAVRQVAESLDAPSLEVLTRCAQDGYAEHPSLETMGQALRAISIGNAIQRLLTLGLLSVRYKVPTSQELQQLQIALIGSLLIYETTRFGHAVLAEVMDRIGSNDLSDSRLIAHDAGKIDCQL